MEPADVLTRARSWIADDPDPATRAELTALVAAAEQVDGPGPFDEHGPAARAMAELGDRFAGVLEFGTAGLRGELGAGPNRMNRAVVIRAARGLVRHLVTMRTPRDGATPHVVIGYDARHGSEQFALDTAAVVVGAGARASLLPRPLPTPVLAHAVRAMDADAGVMVTASHNPPQDNGYKVYLGGADGGSQIVPPADQEIAARILEVAEVARVPRASDGWQVLDEGVVQDYVAAAAAVAAPGGPRALRVVVTSMHGVGAEPLLAALTAAGFTDVVPVPEQAAPDPDFPTVAFPNPEEPGAMDLALALADEVEADLVVANDPDADRCAAAVPTASGWVRLSGDELGALLGEHLLRRGGTGTLACSLVSSQLLGLVAAAHGQPHRETLTGFKWISRVPDLLFGYEEALGYCVDPARVRDKDGISAAVLLCELAATVRADGGTLQGRLDDLAVRHGLHLTEQVSVRVADLTLIRRTMTRLRRHPPQTLGGAEVATAEDLAHPTDGLPPTDGLRYRTTRGDRVVVRPSGTEPKLKCYLEVVLPTGADTLANTRVRAGEQMARLRADVESLLA